MVVPGCSVAPVGQLHRRKQSSRKRKPSNLPLLGLLSKTRSWKDRIMASRKSNRRARPGANGRPARAGGSGVVGGGIGGHAPDVAATRRNHGVRSGAAYYAGAIGAQAWRWPCPDKQSTAFDNRGGLCGQLPVGYYLAGSGKSFNPIIGSVKYTSYEINKQPKLAGFKAYERCTGSKTQTPGASCTGRSSLANGAFQPAAAAS